MIKTNFDYTVQFVFNPPSTNNTDLTNTPNRVSAKERGIPHVLKGVDKPLFRKSEAEPFNVTTTIIQKEMRTEDMDNNNVKSNPSVPEVPVKVVPTTETNSDT